MSVYLKWEEPKEFALKKHKENARSVLKITVGKVIGSLFLGGLFMLSWYLGTRQECNDAIPLWAALLISVGIVLFILLVVPVLEAQSSPSRNRVKITNKGIWLFGYGQNRIWRFGDIADFRITKEQIEESTIDIIELTNFDGIAISSGISSTISIDMLQTLLSEQIHIARDQIKRSLKGPILYWQMWLGTVMVVLGLSALIVLGVASFDIKDREKDVTFIKGDLKETKEQFASGNPTTLQEKAFSKVAAKAYFAIHYIIDLELSQLRILVGSIAAGILLFGCNLILWARNRRIYHRMRRLEVMCLELQTSQNQTKP